jgi:hypothetical protein
MARSALSIIPAVWRLTLAKRLSRKKFWSAKIANYIIDIQAEITLLFVRSHRTVEKKGEPVGQQIRAHVQAAAISRKDRPV